MKSVKCTTGSTSRITSADLFGEDSDEVSKTSTTSVRNGTVPPLYSYFTKRDVKGFTRQISETKQGKYYVELKIYNTEEIKKIMPINRWRYAITTIKTKIDTDKESWQHIKDFVTFTRRDFKNCPSSVVGSYES